MVPYPLVNGSRHSWSSVAIEANGMTYGGFTAINYEPLLDGQSVRGNGPNVIGHTTGQSSWTGDFEMLLEEWNDFQMTLGPGFMLRYFNMRITYSDNGVSTIVDTLSGCRVKSVGVAAQASSGDALVRKVPLLITSGTLNGINPFPGNPGVNIGNVGGAIVDGVRRIGGF